MVQIADTARENAEKYGIESAAIRETVEGVTEVTASTVRGPETITAPWDAEYPLYARDYFAPNGPYFVVVLAGESDGETAALSLHVVPERILQTRQQGRPLAMLRILAHSPDFGLDVSVWGNGVRYVPVGTRLVPAGSSEGVQLAEAPPEGHAVALEDRTRQLEDGEIQVLLAFAVDATAVREDLGLG